MISRLLALPLGLVIFVSESRWEPYLWDAIFFGVGCILVAISTVGRLWCSLYISGYKSRSLIAVGPYSLCRHPLYLFSLCGAVGVGFTTETLTMPLVAGLVFALYYPAVARAEEQKMAQAHGADYAAYAKSVPRFLPRKWRVSEPEQYVVNPVVYRKSMLDALWFVWLVGMIELAEAFREAGILPTLLHLY